MDSLKFENRNYRIRQLEIEDAGVRIIASTALNKRLMTGEGSYTSQEARLLDEMIYFYVEPDILKLNDTSLSNYVNKNCIWIYF